MSSEQSTWAIVSIIFVNGEIWAGTNTGAVLLVNPKVRHLSSHCDKRDRRKQPRREKIKKVIRSITIYIFFLFFQTGKLEHIIPLQKSGRVSLLHAGRSCIWASCENEKICMINAQVFIFCCLHLFHFPPFLLLTSPQAQMY